MSALGQESTAPNQDPRSDSELLRLFLERRDQSAMTAIIGRHGPLIMGLCRTILRNDHDAADAFQATFLVLLKKAKSIGKPASLASWLYGVACRVALRARSQSTRRNKFEGPGMDITSAVNSNSVEADNEETVSLIHEELRRLPERFRLPVILCCMEGASRDDAARHLGWKVGSLKGRLERGREMLRLRLARRGLVLSAAVLTGMLAREALGQVPVALISSTMNAAMLIASGQSLTTSAVSYQTAVLTQDVSKSMLITKLQIVGLILLAGGVATAGSALVLRNMLAAAPTDILAVAQAKQTATGANQGEPKNEAAKNEPAEKIDQTEARAQSARNLKELALAMMQINVAGEPRFPPAAIYGDGDKPLLSWRVLLLPHLGHQRLYDQFKLDEPWDSDHNKPLLARMPDVYAAPGLRDKFPYATFYQVFTGAQTIFDGHRSLNLGEIKDGTSNTALIVESGTAVPWTKPIDLPYVADKPLPKLGGLFDAGFHAVLADGRVVFIRKGVAEKDLRDVITAVGGTANIDFSKLTN